MRRRDRAVVVALLLALGAPSWWRATNSYQDARRAADAWERREYSAAAAAYRRAHESSPSARTQFNLGTAQTAAGELEEGAANLAAAASDPELGAEAFYNRGNGALASEAFDDAIRDYTEALRARPSHTAAKRNLEIALARRESSRRQAEQQQNQQSGARDQEEQQAPAEGDRQQPAGEIDPEALLRSVQQQEQEELRRMKGRAADVPVGW